MSNRSRGESVWVNPATLKIIDSWATRTGRSRSWVIALALGALASTVAKDKDVANVGRDFVRGIWRKPHATLLILGTAGCFWAARCGGGL